MTSKVSLPIHECGEVFRRKIRLHGVSVLLIVHPWQVGSIPGPVTCASSVSFHGKDPFGRCRMSCSEFIQQAYIWSVRPCPHQFLDKNAGHLLPQFLANAVGPLGVLEDDVEGTESRWKCFCLMTSPDAG